MNRNIVKSNYYYLSKVYQGKNNIVNSRSLAWEQIIYNRNNIHKIENTDNLNKSVLNNRVVELFNSVEINRILNYMDEYIDIINWFNTNITYQIAIDCSRRSCITNDKILDEKKETLIYTIKYNNESGTLITSGYSISLDQFDINHIKSLLESECLKLTDFSLAKVLCFIPEFEFVCFSPFTATIVNHELFGHLFEEDNYKNIEAFKKLRNFPYYLSVHDSPHEPLSGYCTFDDYGQMIKREVIIDEGSLINLITDSTKLGINRCRAGAEFFLPRVTNTMVTASRKTSMEYSYYNTVFIEAISQAILRKNILVLVVESSYINLKGSICKLPMFRIELNIYDMINGIVGFWGENACYSTIDCIKKNQRCGGVGISSPGMVVKLRKCDSKL